MSAHLEVVQGWSVRSFQVVIRTSVSARVPSLLLRGLVQVSSRELRVF